MKQEKKQRNRWSGCWNLQNRDREAKTMKIKTDVVIVGTGVAGMFSALKLPRDKKNRDHHKRRYAKQRFLPGTGRDLCTP